MQDLEVIGEWSVRASEAHAADNLFKLHLWLLRKRVAELLAVSAPICAN